MRSWCNYCMRSDCQSWTTELQVAIHAFKLDVLFYSQRFFIQQQTLVLFNITVRIIQISLKKLTYDKYQLNRTLSNYVSSSVNAQILTNVAIIFIRFNKRKIIQQGLLVCMYSEYIPNTSFQQTENIFSIIPLSIN